MGPVSPALSMQSCPLRYLLMSCSCDSVLYFGKNLYVSVVYCISVDHHMVTEEKFFLLLRVMGPQKLGLDLTNQFQMEMT